MSLIKCKECKYEVSSKADKCPKCGVKNPGTTTKDVLIGVLAIVFLGALVTRCIPTSKNPTPEELQAKVDREAAAAAACRDNLECWAEKAIKEGGHRCIRAIEGLAKYDHRWSDDSFAYSARFTAYSWLDKKKGTLKLAGDKVAFQNGLGAFLPHRYVCMYDPNAGNVLDVTARPGKIR